MGGFSLLALLLAGLGVYAVVAFAVKRRTHEIGICVALGATHARLISMVVRQSLVVGGIGVLAGLLLAVFASMLFGVAPTDLITLVLAAALLIALTAVAAFLPALRAARIDPMQALREE
jgi:ABC-type antimicrobial peptide transport system permease subunit